MGATATSTLTPAEVLAERGTPPLGSIWKYYNPHYITNERERRFEDPLSDVAEALIEVHASPALRFGYLLDVYLRFNSRQGGFNAPSAASEEAGNKLSRLLPWEFWELVDLGLLKRLDEPEGS